jgi:hypothetical protein
MAEEEQVLLEKRHAHFSDKKLMALEGSILSDIAPDQDLSQRLGSSLRP